jgi:hypothetical protein
MAKRFLPSLLALAVFATASLPVAQAQNDAPTATTQKETTRMLRHAVLFKFKDSAKAGDIKKVEDAFRALPAQIPEIVDFEWGTNNSPENLAQGFTHLFFLSFNDEAGRAKYLPHPAHKAFGQVLGPHLDKVLVLDYWTQK